MTELAAFPTALTVLDIPAPPQEPDLFVLREPEPPLVLILNGAEYHFPAEILPQFCRFTAEQLTAVNLMRQGGIAEDVIQAAFPRAAQPVVAGVGLTVAGEAYPTAPAAAGVLSPPPAAAAPAEQVQVRSRCPHNRQEDDGMGNIVCAVRGGCGKIITRGAGFVDNRNPGWNGMSRQGAAAFDTRVAGSGTHFAPAYRGELA